MSFKIFIFSLLLFVIPSFILYKSNTNNLLIQSEDTIPAIFLPVAIINDHTIYLDKYYEMMIKRYPHPDDKKQILGLTPFYLKKIDNHYLSAFPLVSGVLGLPVYFLPLMFGMPITWENLGLLARLTSAIIVALSGVFLYKTALHFLDDKKACLLTCAYLFATINFASISQALWQHGTLELFTLASLYFLLKAKTSNKDLMLSGLFLGFAVLSRPTAGIALIFLGLYVLKEKGFVKALRFSFPVLISVAIFFLYNFLFYQSVSNQGYAGQLFDSWQTPLYLGFPGMWLSPSKGILTYSPIFIFSIVGVFLLFKKNFELTNKNLFKYFAIIVLTHTVVLSMWKHWYGGWSFGYRMASDIIPYLTLLLIPYFKSSLYEKTKNWFYLAFVWSVFIQLFGLIFFDGIWHAAYDRGFRNQTWLWSLKNSEMVFYVRRILVKFHVLTSPL